MSEFQDLGHVTFGLSVNISRVHQGKWSREARRHSPESQRVTLRVVVSNAEHFRQFDGEETLKHVRVPRFEALSWLVGLKNVLLSHGWQFGMLRLILQVDIQCGR